MSNLAIVGAFEAAPGRRDELLRSLIAHRARCLADEPGTLEFEVLVPRGNDAKVIMYEVYRDDDAFEVHRSGASIAQWRKEAAGMVAKVDIAQCTLATDVPKSPAIRPHQPGQADFRSIFPEEIEWKPFPAFPPSARLAVVVGDPSQPGPYVVRVKVPTGVKLMPHRHPEDRIYTVMSGVFYIGLGERFDGERVKAYPPGSVIVLPGNTSHFHWAKSGEYVTQVTAIGPLGLEYLDSADDPRERGPGKTE
jgi:quinol monooxygenase YgiN/quercetin dioxygenase-like cupin family protein